MLSAAEMMAAAGDLAASLRAGACAPDEPIALFIANEPLDLAGFLGIWLAGCVAAPIHVATPATAAQALVGRLGSRFAIRAGRLALLWQISAYNGRILDSQISCPVIHGWSAYRGVDHGGHDIGLEEGA
jgi:hypothetical protein